MKKIAKPSAILFYLLHKNDLPATAKKNCFWWAVPYSQERTMDCSLLRP